MQTDEGVDEVALLRGASEAEDATEGVQPLQHAKSLQLVDGSYVERVG